MENIKPVFIYLGKVGVKLNWFDKLLKILFQLFDFINFMFEYEMIKLKFSSLLDFKTSYWIVWSMKYHIPIFCWISDSVLDCRKFVENQCLSFTLACLSCHDGVMRGAAYHILANFLSQLQGARFQEVKQVLYFVEIVRNSIEKPNIKLPCIITLFLSRVATELLKPGKTHINFFSKYKWRS